MDLVLKARRAAGDKQTRMFGYGIEQRLEPFAVGFGEVAENMAVNTVPLAGMADAEPNPVKAAADMGVDRTDAIVAGGTAAGLNPNLAGHEIELVMEHIDVGALALEITHGFADAAAGFIHVGSRLQGNDFHAAENAFSDHSLKLAPPGREAMAVCDGIDRHESDVVPVERILRPGIAEADEEQHGADPCPAKLGWSARLLLFVAARDR